MQWLKLAGSTVVALAGIVGAVYTVMGYYNSQSASTSPTVSETVSRSSTVGEVQTASSAVVQQSYGNNSINNMTINGVRQ